MNYPEDFINKIICGDCIEIMKEMPDKCIDLILTDPPYGIKITDSCNAYGNLPELSRKPHQHKWDTKGLLKEQWIEIQRISKNQIIFGANYFWEYFYSSQCYIVWDKRGELPKVPFCDTEFAWTSFVKKSSKKYLIRRHGFIDDSQDYNENHPTQKPTELMSQILQDFTSENDIICDPFLGSGTTAEACKLLKRQFIGIEINPDYCKIAEERLAQGVL